ncbi:trafficking protein particle complex subunit 10-like isoform X2 [Dreissena polymorpha]|uniref:trafficking protein particle complex subunit 10-like isoform X2 n=1 Tax=Dreissena polymorpha TaxID=45954 RepID=UPI002264F5AF|nr:trafficking protein particle complex subunit 10-like isoform X2 [Dreissena polymorpha]
MEAKPIVTSHGNQLVFSSLVKPLLEDLPKEPAEWKRSYGRPARNVHLEASFVPYDDDILPDDSVKTLVSRLYFHVYWTDCDLEGYKNTVKEEITEWQNALKNKNIPDWMIVVVHSDENKMKTKLLPRSSVYDKIKSDFGGKQPERIVVLELHREDRKGGELWQGFLSRLRQLLLQAFTRHLQKYEDNMRAQREKRNDIGWNFQNYFIVQEELGFMFEMLGLYDDALIQYDELDALFTQFVVNHASGQAVPWLRTLVEPCKSWAGLCLQKPISWEKRNLIKDNAVSLLELRNYLFTRQCALLLLVKRPAEIVQRAIDYLHETVQEMKVLEIAICEGGLDCWVYLSGLEVLLKCEAHTDPINPRSQALNTAYLWDYICRKLHKLGELCGLMPGADLDPTSTQLDRVVNLTAGMGLEPSTEELEEGEAPHRAPSDKLREALSSREAFQKIYLEQSELAMGTFKHIGRFRSARLIGKNLADFYMKLGEPQKAENFLLDAMTSYHKEGWTKLRDMACLELAQCQYQTGIHHKYVKTGCQVAGSSLLETRDRLEHMNNVMQLARSSNAGTMLLKASPLLKIDVSRISQSKVGVDEAFQITVTIDNQGPCDLTCDSIWLTLVESVSEFSDRRIHKLKSPVIRQASNSSLDNRHVMNLTNVNLNKQTPTEISLRALFEGTLEEPVLAGISCMNSHELLKRNDSSGGILKPTDDTVKKDVTSQQAAVTGVVLKQGENTVTLNFEGVLAGCYSPGQVGVKVGLLEFLKDTNSGLSVMVTCDETRCEIIPETLVAGIGQEVTVCIYSGNVAIDPNSKVKVTGSENLSITTSSHDNTVLLGGVARGGQAEWKMRVFHQPMVTGGLKVDDKIVFDCSWLPRPLIMTLTFVNPFKVTHRLYTARDMKYIQVTVHAQGGGQFQLSDWSLVATNGNDLELVCLNKPLVPMKIVSMQSCSFVWQLKCNTPELPPLDLTFTSAYMSPLEVPAEERQLRYSFKMADFQTLLTVKADICPSGDNKVCKTGVVSSFKLHVTQMSAVKPLADQEIMYRLEGGPNWKVHGKSSGVFHLSGGSYSHSVQVIPLTAGFLPLPAVSLLKYNPQIMKEEDERLSSTDDESSDTDSQPLMSEFGCGQVYYSGQGKQVHVYPVEVTGEVEVTIM